MLTSLYIRIHFNLMRRLQTGLQTRSLSTCNWIWIFVCKITSDRKFCYKRFWKLCLFVYIVGTFNKEKEGRCYQAPSRCQNWRALSISLCSELCCAELCCWWLITADKWRYTAYSATLRAQLIQYILNTTKQFSKCKLYEPSWTPKGTRKKNKNAENSTLFIYKKKTSCV